MTLPLLHETWFEEQSQGLDWSFAWEGATLALLAAAILVTVCVRLVARRWPGVDEPWLGRMAPWMPFAVRLHLAVSLVGLLAFGNYLAPTMDLRADVVGVALGAVVAIVAVGMATGFHARAAAWLLVAAGPLGMLEFGVGDVLQRVDVLGLALFVILAGPGRWSADFELGRARDPGVGDAARAVWALRMAVGGALIVVAFAEKLANPDLALAFLADHPHLNVAREIGLPIGDLEFVRLAGAIEVLFGLLVLSGALPQIIVIAAGIPFNATLWFFGAVELVGHLPVYGAMLVLLVYGSHPALRPAVSDLWPWAAPRGVRTEPAPAR